MINLSHMNYAGTRDVDSVKIAESELLKCLTDITQHNIYPFAIQLQRLLMSVYHSRVLTNVSFVIHDSSLVVIIHRGRNRASLR